MTDLNAVLDSLGEELGVSFRSRELLELAFVHSSYMNENPDSFAESNERLEFLGDALIDLSVAHELYAKYPDRPEGELTALRAALVRGETLARTAESLRLGRFLLMGRGEEAGGGRTRRSNLAAVFESLVGALFLDQGYERASAFVLAALADEFEVLQSGDTAKNPKSILQELVQARGTPPPDYRTVDITGRDHDRLFTVEVLVGGKVVGRGRGRRKSYAEQDAAREALKSLGTED